VPPTVLFSNANLVIGLRTLTEPDAQLRGDRFLTSGDESGTAPEDRPFRPDVEGLRAIAVLLVVLYHSGVSALSGGYIGVDVFFVISGFVITGVLLRERVSSGRTSILAFYGRRCRRIIPAATLVIIVTVALSYFVLGVGAGGRTATDARWAAVFLANFHFSAVGTNYLGSQLPASPLQNYWSLSVEEQFYVAYPTLFLLLASIRTRLSLRARLAVGLLVVIGASLFFSITDTATHATSSYFSPLTRAWELALGGLVVVGTPWLKKVPVRIAGVAAWLGFGAVLFAALSFTSQTAYPGSLVSVPVIGTGLIIAGGVRAPRFGVEALLSRAPLRGLGKLSYSLYLWHWPILIIAAEYTGRTSLSVPQNLGWDVVALVASAATFTLVEDRVRHAKTVLRIRWASIGLGAGLVAITLGVITLQSEVVSPQQTAARSAPVPGNGHADLPEVLRIVAASAQINHLTLDVRRQVSLDVTDWVADLGDPPVSTGCTSATSREPACVFGDRTGAHTMILYGDSHAAMWFKALDDIATRVHWRLISLYKAGCPAAPLPSHLPSGEGDWAECDEWHHYAIDRINRINPNLLIVSQASYYQAPNGIHYTPAQWQRGLEQLFRQVKALNMVKVVIGDLPGPETEPITGPFCLIHHLENAQACALPRVSSMTPYRTAERLATVSGGARYIDVTPWFCGPKTCSSVIGRYDVFLLENHVTVGYSRLLEGVLAESLDLQSVG